MPTGLRFEPDYLKSLVAHVIRLNRPRSLEEATMLTDIRDYLMYLTLDALNDEALARILTATFAQLGLWLERKRRHGGRKTKPYAGIWAGSSHWSSYLAYTMK